MPHAASISIRETLELLDGQYSAVSTGVANGAYAFWLGSGISRDRVIDLHGVLAKLLEFLRTNAADDPDCGYRRALEKIIDLSAPTPEDRAGIDFSKAVSEWVGLDGILRRLWKQYSSVLSVEIPNQKFDYLLWEGLDFANTFANQEADAEHLAIGMLALEGAVTELASANWDGLLEAAMKELCHGDASYCITVTGKDLRGQAAHATLYKFHGCALRAIDNEPEYRPLLIARTVQITRWSADDRFKIVRDQLGALVQRKRTMMIGLSAQDTNIKHLFSEVNQHQGWRWDDSPTPIVFSAQDLGDDQRDLLNLVYTEPVYEEHREAICGAARLQSYAKPLLLALLLHVLATKLEVLAGDAHAPNLDADARRMIIDGLKELRNSVAEADRGDRAAFARQIALTIARTRHQLQDGASEKGGQRYFPIDDQPAHLMKGKPALKSSGQREAAVALGLIGLGKSNNVWECSVDDPQDPRSGALRLHARDTTARVFFAANDDTIVNLIECGAFDETDSDAVVICSGRVAERQQRSPSGAWRDGAVGPRLIPFGPMLRDAHDLDDLRDQLHGEIGL